MRFLLAAIFAIALGGFVAFSLKKTTTESTIAGVLVGAAVFLGMCVKTPKGSEVKRSGEQRLEAFQASRK